MKDELRNHVEVLFADVPKNKRSIDFKEELINNLEARYDDMIASGFTEEDAYKSAVNGIGDVDELLEGLKEPSVFDESSYQEQRKKDARVVTISIALYFLALVVLIVFGAVAESPAFKIQNQMTGIYESNEILEIIGLILMLVIAVVPTCMLIYHYTSRPAYKKREETIVEEFKEWSADGKRLKAIRGSISTVLAMLTVIIYFLISFTTNAWHLTWLVFLVMAALEAFINLMFNLKKMSGTPSGSFELDETKDGDFDANSSYNKSVKAIQGSISAILWLITVIIYIALSFMTGAWHITWIVYLIAACLQTLLSLYTNLKLK